MKPLRIHGSEPQPLQPVRTTNIHSKENSVIQGLATTELLCPDSGDRNAANSAWPIAEVSDALASVF